MSKGMMAMGMNRLDDVVTIQWMRGGGIEDVRMPYGNAHLPSETMEIKELKDAVWRKYSE